MSKDLVYIVTFVVVMLVAAIPDVIGTIKFYIRQWKV